MTRFMQTNWYINGFLVKIINVEKFNKNDRFGKNMLENYWEIWQETFVTNVDSTSFHFARFGFFKMVRRNFYGFFTFGLCLVQNFFKGFV